MSKTEKTQKQKFIEAARDAGADESEVIFNDRLRRVASAPKSIVHKSDCAVHDAPAMKPGKCTCGADTKARK